ncbi:MAG TPA: hypothetical protein VF957_23510 [Bradyrhizobium sp.]
MSYQFLDGVNKVLERLTIVQGADGLLTSFTGDPRANDISVCIQAWNEVVQELADSADLLPGLTVQGSLTPVATQREYAIPTTTPQMEIVRTVVNQTRRLPLLPYPGGFQQMIIDQPDPTIFIGTPIRWCISDVTGKIRFDFTPQTADQSDTYQVYGEPRIALANTTDTFPFTDTVVDQLIEGVAQRWKRSRRPSEYDEAEYQRSQAAAIRWIRRETPPQSYGPTRRRRR